MNKRRCHNHPDREALSVCHSCGEPFCRECLVEGREFYYCRNQSCMPEDFVPRPQKRKTDSIASRSISPARLTTRILALFWMVIYGGIAVITTTDHYSADSGAILTLITLGTLPWILLLFTPTRKFAYKTLGMLLKLAICISALLVIRPPVMLHGPAQMTVRLVFGLTLALLGVTSYILGLDPP